MLCTFAGGCFGDDYVLTIRALQFTGEVDDTGPNEIEVYLFDDDTDEMLGCAGTKQGMGIVDVNDVRYDLDVDMIDTDGRSLGDEDIGDRIVRFEVWEDDDDPVCPVSPRPEGNELLGVSAALPADDWIRLAEPISQGQIVELVVDWH